MTFPELLKSLDDQQATCQDLVHSFAALEQHQSEAQEASGHLNAEFEGISHTDPTATAQGVITELHTFAGDIQKHAGQLDEAAKAIDQEIQTSAQTLHQEIAHFDAEMQKAIGGLHALETEVQAGTHQISDLHAKFEQLQSKLEAAVTQALQEATQSQSALTNATTHLVSQIDGQFTHTAEADFTELATQVGTHAKTELESGVQTSTHTADQTLQAFANAAQHSADQLDKAILKVLDDLLAEIEHQAKEELVHEIKDLLEKAVDEFTHAAEEFAATMLIGQEVAVALAPILPEIKAAEMATTALVHLTE